MLGRAREHLSYANVMATIAVFIALGGGAYALTRGEVKTKHIAARAVTPPKLAPSARSQAYETAATGNASLATTTSGGTVVLTLTLPPGRYIVHAKTILFQSSAPGAPSCRIRDDGVVVDRAAANLDAARAATVPLNATTGAGTVTLECGEEGGSAIATARRMVATRVAKVTEQ